MQGHVWRRAAPLAQVAEHGGRVVVHAVEHEHPQQRRRLVVAAAAAVGVVVVVGGGGGGVGGGGVSGVGGGGGGGGGACTLGRGIGPAASEAGRRLAELLEEGRDLREERCQG